MGGREERGTGPKGWFHHTFRALRIRNFRLYMTGQAISLIGTWAQRIGQDWLVLELTHSGTALGALQAAQFLPILLGGPWGGVLADRFDKHRMLVATQSAAASLALLLGVLTVTHVVALWMVFVLAALLGLVTAADTPARQTFVQEMVGADDLRNAVTLNNIATNFARIGGPAIAAALIAVVGTGPCFLVNAASFLGTIAALLRMDVTKLERSPPQARAKGQLREGFSYVRNTPDLLGPLILMAVVGMLGYEMPVIFPLMAKYTFGGGAGVYGAMTAGMGLGAISGGLVAAGRSNPNSRSLMLAALGFGGALLVAAVAPNLTVELVAMVAVGAGSVTFIAVSTTTLQLRADPAMRGRVMALWAMAFMGTTPIGGPIVGFVGQHVGPRYGLGLGGAATVLAGMVSGLAGRRHDSRSAAAESGDTTSGGRSGAPVGAISADTSKAPVGVRAGSVRGG